MNYTELVLIEKRMTKILKKIKVPKTDAVIFKRERSKFWYVRFYVSSEFKSHHMFQQSLKEENYKKSLKLAYKVYKDFWSRQNASMTPITRDQDSVWDGNGEGVGRKYGFWCMLKSF